jgi:rSAM/selenodomain-associated transferase 2
MKYSFSVIIPVLRESSLISQTIDHVYDASAGFDLEVIVVDGDDKGQTISAIKNREVIKILSPKGRGKQMNKGASVASGEILLFLHADTELPEQAFKTISLVMEGEQYAGGAFDLGIKSDRAVFRLIEKLVNIRTRLTRVPYGDQAIFIRKGIFFKVNGFREIPVMEDVELMRHIKKLGSEVCIVPQRVKTSPRRWEKEGVVFCTLRNWALISLYSLGVRPDKLVKSYYRDREG